MFFVNKNNDLAVFQVQVGATSESGGRTNPSLPLVLQGRLEAIRVASGQQKFLSANRWNEHG